MNRKKEYPGYLLYFDQMQGLEETCIDEELGLIHRAIFYYARDGKTPEELPKEFRMIWPSIQRKLDEDRAAYEEKCRAASYSAAAKQAKAKGEPVPDRTAFDAKYDRENGLVRKPMSDDEFEKARQKSRAFS